MKKNNVNIINSIMLTVLTLSSQFEAHKPWKAPV
jgi:hypothetical protein